jgi:hypothetical protein
MSSKGGNLLPPFFQCPRLFCHYLKAISASPLISSVGECWSFLPKQPIQSYNRRSCNNLLPKANTNWGKLRSTNYASKDFNNFDSSITNVSSLTQFKTQLNLLRTQCSYCMFVPNYSMIFSFRTFVPCMYFVHSVVIVCLCPTTQWFFLSEPLCHACTVYTVFVYFVQFKYWQYCK